MRRRACRDSTSVSKEGVAHATIETWARTLTEGNPQKREREPSQMTRCKYVNLGAQDTSYIIEILGSIF